MKRSSLKHIHLAGLAAVLLLGWGGESHAAVNATVAVVSDYAFRGVSQTGEDPALQLSLDYSHKSGFYLGAWGSSVDLGDAAAEIDLYLGFLREYKSGFYWNLGTIRYNYPKEGGLNNQEIYAGVGYKAFSTKLYYSDDFAGTQQDGTYFEVNWDFELPKKFTLGVHAGNSTFDAIGIEDYRDYKLYIAKEFKVLTANLSWVDTDTEQFGDAGDQLLILTLSRTFELHK